MKTPDLDKLRKSSAGSSFGDWIVGIVFVLFLFYVFGK